MRNYLSLLAGSVFMAQVFAGDDDWLSPVYKPIFQNKLPIPPEKSPKYTYTNQTTGAQIDYYEFEIKEFESQIYPNLKPAKLVGYDGVSPGPTIRVKRGRESVVRFVNKAKLATSVHLHGSYSRAPFDGWAEDLTEPGSYKDYYYPNKQSARTLWYHDHAVSQTAVNAYFGQAGFYILEDGAENALGLPKGSYDLALALASKQYNSDGTLFSPAAERDSLWGDVIHVNGQPWPYHSVEPRKYRLRFLDTSVSRAFKLTFETDDNKKIPFHVIASDAGLLPKPVQSDNLEISMAERWELVVDFSAYAGKNITVKNARDVQADEDYNSTNKVMRFVVGNTVSNTENNNLPSTLRNVPLPPNKSGVDRQFKLERSNGEWQINDVTFADVNNRILAKPPRGAVEVWEFSTGGGWSHPIHVHLVDFQVIYRKGSRDGVLPYEKEALKDVVLLGKSETVRVIARFAPWDGVYMFHCHNLIHEDHDMMAAFNVTSLGDWGYPETTQFIDPMDQRFRSRPANPADFTQDAILARINELYVLDAYKDPDKVEAALESYWANGGKASSTTLATSTRTSSSSGSTTARATTSSTRVSSTSTARASSTSTRR
ncbi:oxidase cueO precursor [Periconia macrospinosa]|uniref:Oxidase cueO n=1 Tax=Periconia macrospinosa TaxID=97972 RepID=A0A2V1ECL2_9PLEO|nr:oxidase cueO precursor [Periconia macrospinosa]